MGRRPLAETSPSVGNMPYLKEVSRPLAEHDDQRVRVKMMQTPEEGR